MRQHHQLLLRMVTLLFAIGGAAQGQEPGYSCPYDGDFTMRNGRVVPSVIGMPIKIERTGEVRCIYLVKSKLTIAKPRTYNAQTACKADFRNINAGACENNGAASSVMNPANYLDLFKEFQTNPTFFGESMENKQVIVGGRFSKTPRKRYINSVTGNTFSFPGPPYSSSTTYPYGSLMPRRNIANGAPVIIKFAASGSGKFVGVKSVTATRWFFCESCAVEIPTTTQITTTEGVCPDICDNCGPIEAGPPKPPSEVEQFCDEFCEQCVN